MQLLAGRDHPRRCGENGTVTEWTEGEMGSPPQVRGKRNITSTTAGTNGITPAGAGKTAQDRCFSAGYEDHPRRCGENFTELLAYRKSIGSPPQVRGKP